MCYYLCENIGHCYCPLPTGTQCYQEKCGWKKYFIFFKNASFNRTKCTCMSLGELSMGIFTIANLELIMYIHQLPPMWVNRSLSLSPLHRNTMWPTEMRRKKMLDFFFNNATFNRTKCTCTCMSLGELSSQTRSYLCIFINCPPTHTHTHTHTYTHTAHTDTHTPILLCCYLLFPKPWYTVYWTADTKPILPLE